MENSFSSHAKAVLKTVEASLEREAASARPPVESQGHCERSRLSTGSLPVSSVRTLLAIWERREAGLRAAGKTDLADMVIVMADELRAEADFPTLRQPAGNMKGQP